MLQAMRLLREIEIACGAVFSLNLSVTSKRNFKTVLKTIYPLNFQEFQAVLGGNKGNTSGKL